MKRSAIIKLFIGIAALLAAVSVAVVLATGSFSAVNEDGFAMPADAGIDRALTAGSGGTVRLVPVGKEDTISSTLGYFYLSDTRTGVSVDYPIWVHQGAGLRFLTEETWLISQDLELLRTYEGLYLSDGTTYTEDRVQADNDEFILLALSNGLYMNAQPAELHTLLEDVEIPINSVLYMDGNGMRWYAPDGGTMRYREVRGVMDATISIGDNTYDYAALLEALGLVNDAMAAGYPNGGYDKLAQADDVLNGTANAAAAGRSDGAAGDAGSGQTGEKKNSENAGGNTGTGDDDGASGGNKRHNSKEPPVPSEPDAPEEPDRPDVPTRPDDPERPDNPPTPSQPGEPDQPEKPDDPDKPDDPKDPEGPTDPDDPAGPDTPGGADGPSKPDDPGSSDPSDPGGSEDPDKPTDPDGPENPDTPVDPDDPINPDDPVDPDSPAKPGDPSQDEPGSGKPVPYVEPQVEISGLSAWSYAINGQLTIHDPSRVIAGSVRVAVYAKLKDGKATGELTADGLPIYTADDGRSAKLRRSFTGSREFTLATLQPDTTFYLQYSYKYIKEEDGDTIDPETGEVQKVRKRVMYFSDFIQIKTSELEGSVSPVNVSWSSEFAASNTGLTLRGLTVANSSGYRQEDESFENFKLNTLPYLNRIELELKDGRTTTVVRIPANVLSAAQSGAAVFSSTAPKLASNSRYVYTAKALDRFGNTIPMTLETNDEGVIYTARSAPAVEIETVENVVDALTLRVTVHDADSALLTDGNGEPLPLYLTAVETGGISASDRPVILGGVWKNQTSLSGDGENRLLLAEPRDGAVYEFTLDTLAFAQAYTITVTGSYSPQPAGVTEPRLNDVSGAALGVQRVYTAAITSGIINYDLGYYDLKDSSVTVGLQMNRKTTLEVLPLLDMMRISILRNGERTPDCTVELDIAELDDPDRQWVYDVEAQALVLQEGDALTPRLLLMGGEASFAGLTPWQAMQVRAVEDADTGDVTFTTAAELRVVMPEGTLKTSSAYTVGVEMLAVKAGKEYSVPTVLSNDTFTTKKTQLQIIFDDLFAAGDSLEFIGLQIYDSDGTIQRDGLVYADLYFGTTLLMRKEIHATTDKNSGIQQLRFENLIENGAYTLQFVASAYNDAEGFSSYVSNKLLQGYQVRGGSSLHGALVLENTSMVAENGEVSYKAELTVAVSDARGYLKGSDGTASAAIQVYYSSTMNEPEYQTDPVLERSVSLVENGDGSWSVDPSQARQVLEGLKPDSRYRVVLSAQYNNKQVKLAEMSFVTDSDYIIIHDFEELKAKFTAENSNANFLVVNDITLSTGYSGGKFTLNGTIDFQGHRLIRAQGYTGYFLGVVGRTGVLRNVVYELPEGVANAGAIVGTNRGLMEDIVIRSQSARIIDGDSKVLCCNTNAAGTIRRLIVRLEGDLTIKGTGGIIAYNDSVLEDFYVYSTNGAGVIFENGGSLLCKQNAWGGVFRRGFTVVDIWSGDKGTLWGTGGRNSTLSNLYHVGEFYQYLDGKSKTALSASRKVGSAGSCSELYCISSGSYVDNSCTALLRTVNTLRDGSWQRSVVGSSWDVEDCVSMGFYPRLLMSSVMQPAQEYLTLPLAGSADIEVLSDSWATGDYANQGNESGNIMLKLSNPANVTISGFTIPGLMVTNILSQTVCSDGTYEVVASVKVDNPAPQYTSVYTVTGVTYTTGGRTQLQNLSYKTDEISFWKPLRTPADWTAIDDSATTRSWNYRLVNDLDLSALTPGAVTIDGNQNRVATSTPKTAFTGKIDGDWHTIRGITLNEVRSPWVIWHLATGASVKNLIVEGMQITAGTSPLSGHCGFIATSNGILENLHFRSCSVTGTGYIGTMVGNLMTGNTAEIRYCSATDCSLANNGTASIIKCGGLAGSTTFTPISNCYVRNISIVIGKNATAEGIGGILGYTYQLGLSVENSYATGTIDTTTGMVGGITGCDRAQTYARTQNCWADVNISAGGSNVGGLSGSATAYTRGLAMGDITSHTTVNVNRGVGNGTAGQQVGVFAFAGQSVSGIMGEDKGDAARLISSAELASRSTWVDIMHFGANFSYEPLARECMPKAVDGDGNELYGQEDIPIPGASSEPTLQVGETKYTAGTPGEFSWELIFRHPGMTHEEIKALYDGGQMELAVEGMDFSEATLLDGLVSVALEKDATQEETTSITMTASEKALTMCTDTYPVMVSYTEKGRAHSLKNMLAFDYIPYWDVPDLATWNALMAAGHGENKENFRITGMIDFERHNTAYNDLWIARLVGEGTGEVGFCNLNYEAPKNGVSWISAVTTSIRDLAFRNMTYDGKMSTSSQLYSGMIMKAPDVENLTIDSFRLLPGISNCNSRIGFFGQVGASANITLTNSSAETAGKLATGGLYAGEAGVISGIYAEKLTVSCGAGGAGVGGIVGANPNIAGYADGSRSYVGNVTVTSKASSVGGLGGAGGNLADVDVENVTVSGTHTTSGLMPGCGYCSNVTVTNVHVTATSAGGYAGICHASISLTNSWRDVVIRDSSVSAVATAGVIIGAKGSNYIGNFANVTVLNCQVRSTSGSAGGLVGKLEGDIAGGRHLTLTGCVVRDTTIVSENGAAGGIIGYAVSGATKRVQIRNCYVAEDVKVQSVNGSAGGIAGELNNFQIEGVAVGADVITGGQNAGGFVGLFRNETTTDTCYLRNSYFHGSVSAFNYVGGVIGRWNTPSKQAAVGNYTGLLTAGQVRSDGSKCSLWANAPGTLGVGDMKVAIHDGMLLNGQSAESLVAAEEVSGGTSQPIPKSGVLYRGSDFGVQAKYTDAGMTAAAWDYTALTAELAFMPYPKSGGAVLEYAKQTAGGYAAGIPLPEQTGGAVQALKVYASGVDTVNVETEPNAAVTVNDSTFTANENGVVTLYYDFRTTLAVKEGTNSVSCAASELRRTVMIFDSTWYYIAADGSIHYGTWIEDSTAPQTVALPQGVKALHLWDGKALCDDGNVYELTEDGGTGAATAAGGGLTQCGEDSPFFSYVVTTGKDPVTVKVYHGFTLFGDARVNYRIFERNGAYYTVAPAQNAVYDGVSITGWNTVEGEVRNFFLLGEDGTLVNYSGTVNTKAIGLTDISHIAHNFHTDKPWLLLTYQDGSMAGLDIETGKLLFDTRSPLTTFAAYAGNWIRGIFTGNTGFVDGSFEDSRQAILDGASADGTNMENGSNTENGANRDNGTGAENGTGADTEERGGTGETGGVPSGEYGQASSGGAESGAGGETVSGADGEGTSGSGADGEAVYVPGEGVLSDGAVLYDDSRVTYVSGEGVYVDEVLTFLAAPAADGELYLTPLNGGGANGTADGGADGTELLRQLLGDKVVVYDTADGRYSVKDTAVLTDSMQQSALPNRTAEDTPDAQEQSDEQESGFQIARGHSRRLSVSEKNGTLLLCVVAVSAVIVLLLLYGRFLRGKRRK